jgi:hypothetical protein
VTDVPTHEASQDEIKAAREQGQHDGLARTLGGSSRAALGEGITPHDYDHDTTYDRATAWVEGYNEGLEFAEKEEAEKAGKAAHDAGHAAGVAEGLKHPPAEGAGHEGEVPECVVPPQYAAHENEYKEGFYEGYPKRSGLEANPAAPEPDNYDDAHEEAERYVHLRRKLQEPIDPSYVRKWTAKWGAFPVPELELGEKAAPGELIVLQEQPHIEPPEFGVVE